MKKLNLTWTLSHTSDLSFPSKEHITATVPGAVQLDYAKAHNYDPYYFGLNFKQFDWTEDEYFIYSAPLNFTVSENEKAFLYFAGIDYKYLIKINGEEERRGEGMFTPVTLDITRFAGTEATLEVVIFPIPKRPGAPKGRSQASASVKPPSSYGWDWHPRLVPSGIWNEAFISIVPIGSVYSLDASYRLSADLKKVTVNVECKIVGEGEFEVRILDPDRNVVVSERKTAGASEHISCALTINEPKLWYPRGYGEQSRYMIEVSGAETVYRMIGFRKSELVRNANDVKRFEKSFPKSSLPAPATLMINGKKIFAKGTNWVNAEIFPSMITDERIEELLSYVVDANMNILRMWGGQIINREYFYERCDMLGILVWQEFVLSCNKYPDSDEYLAVLEQESSTIIKRLRTHPCIAFWCGGNELFNSWSGLTVQSHPLRLLDKLCYELDRDTPFNMTSPLHGMAHGTYVKVVVSEDNSDKGGDVYGEEYLSILKRSDFTAYTEFGCNGAATPEYIKKYIMSEADYRNCTPENEVWKAHHAFGAWGDARWLGKNEIVYFFGGFSDMDDLMEKTLYLQSLAYKTTFEEMRRQWPNCSMVINWDFNEPWPCIAGNSLLNWPAEPKPAFDSVKAALRPVLLSMSTPKNRFLTGENFTADIWLLNDTDSSIEPLTAEVCLEYGNICKSLGTVNTSKVSPCSNEKFGSVSFKLTEDIPARFRITLNCKEHPEYDSFYDLVHRAPRLIPVVKKAPDPNSLGAQ